MHTEPSSGEFERDLDFACLIAREAGMRLVGLRQSGRWKDEGILGDVGDQAADALLQGYLRGRYPNDGLLSEETKDDARRLDCERAWIVDPLDGTKEYRSGREDWAVHVALCVGGEPALAAVALPAIGGLIGGVCYRNQRSLRSEGLIGSPLLGDSPAPSPLRVICSRSHRPEWVNRFAESLGAQLVPCGSVGFKVSRILCNVADIYVHNGGLKEWDTCAPEAIARAAGFFVARLDGSPQRYNQEDPRNNEFVVCRPAQAERVLAAAKAAGAQGA